MVLVCGERDDLAICLLSGRVRRNFWYQFTCSEFEASLTPQVRRDRRASLLPMGPS